MVCRMHPRQRGRAKFSNIDLLGEVQLSVFETFVQETWF